MNQQKLAKLLNVSRTTVSRSLTNHPAIGAETRARVQALAAQMGYRGQATRVVRRSRQSKPLTVGVVIGVPAENVALATFPYILQGIRDRAGIEHLAIDVSYQNPATFDTTSKRHSIFRHMRSANWRGAILIYPFPVHAVGMISRKISTVSVLDEYAALGLDIVDVDDVSGFLSMVDRLAQLGHKRIGFVHWHYPVGGVWGYRRFGGYVEGIFRNGLEFRSDWVLNIHKATPRYESAEIADLVFQKLRRDRVTAWVCAADHQAYSLIQSLQARGVRIPADCSITGFDGLEPPPPIQRATSMLVPHEEIGSSALSLLMGRILRPSSPRRKILVEPRLVEGTTVAAPPQS
ncbi:MAG TPA: LacI family DNA-binding transcriptional regulator [Opitutaceae bacterium]|nr:LacI family DNA-binding transcriptional regulator [Opitutaceae bacterium]